MTLVEGDRLMPQPPVDLSTAKAVEPDVEIDNSIASNIKKKKAAGKATVDYNSEDDELDDEKIKASQSARSAYLSEFKYFRQTKDLYEADTNRICDTLNLAFAKLVYLITGSRTVVTVSGVPDTVHFQAFWVLLKSYTKEYPDTVKAQEVTELIDAAVQDLGVQLQTRDGAMAWTRTRVQLQNLKDQLLIQHPSAYSNFAIQDALQLEVLSVSENLPLWRAMNAGTPATDVVSFMVDATTIVREFTKLLPPTGAMKTGMSAHADPELSIEDLVKAQVSAHFASAPGNLPPTAGKPDSRTIAPPNSPLYQDVNGLIQSVYVLSKHFGKLTVKEKCLLCGKGHNLGACVTKRFDKVCRKWLVGTCQNGSTCTFKHAYASDRVALLNDKDRAALVEEYI